jgi:hypothetical protein
MRNYLSILDIEDAADSRGDHKATLYTSAEGEPA